MARLLSSLHEGAASTDRMVITLDPRHPRTSPRGLCMLMALKSLLLLLYAAGIRALVVGSPVVAERVRGRGR